MKAERSVCNYLAALAKRGCRQRSPQSNFRQPNLSGLVRLGERTRHRTAKPSPNGRSTEETPQGNDWVANRTSQGRQCRKRHDGISIKVMQHVPCGVKKPAEADEVIRVKPPVCDVSHECREGKFPRSKPAVEIGCARTRNHDGIKRSPVRLPEKRASADVQNCDEYRPN